MSAPAVSVVIPLYNRAHLIAQTVQSVLDQTVQDFEVVIVDDGSTDDPEPAVAAIGDPRLRLIRQESTGANTARNTGIDAARADVVALLDSDDRFLPHHLKAALTALEGAPDRVIYARILVDRGQGRTFLKPPRAIRPGEAMADYLLCDRGFVQTSTVVLPTVLARKVRYLDGLPYGQDTDFAIRLAHAGAHFRMLEDPSAIWLDVKDESRISARTRPEPRQKWLNGIRPMVSERAYHGDRGWFVAKAHARQGDFGKAFLLYWNAVRRGCYTPRLAATIGLQIFLGRFYRTLADTYVSLRDKGRPEPL